MDAVSAFGAALSLRGADVVGNGTAQGWCLRAAGTQVKVGTWLDVGVTSLAASSFLLCSLLLLVCRLARDYQRAYTAHERLLTGGVGVQVLPPYYLYSQFACFIFIVQMFDLLLPPSSGARPVIAHCLYASHGFVDNWPILFALQRKPEPREATRAVYASLLVVGARAALVFHYATDAVQCSWCGPFFPVPQAMYADIVFAVFYGLCLYSVQRRFCGMRLRRGMKPWCTFMFICYSWISLFAFVTSTGQDFGMCAVALVVLFYTGGYAYMLYQAFVADSREWQDFAGPSVDTIDSSLTASRLLDVTQRGIAVTDYATIGGGAGGSGDAGGDSPSGSLSPSKGSPGHPSRGDSTRSLRRTVRGRMSTLTRLHVPVIRWEDLHLGDRLGSGGYGEVFAATWHSTPVAVKRLYPIEQSAEEGDDPEDVITRFVSEAAVMARVRHPHIVQMLGVSVTRLGSMCIVTELASRGSVLSLLHGRPLRPDATARVLLHAARGMSYLHGRSPPIMHRDLKAANLLVDDAWNIKLCDMGLSREVAETGEMTRVGSVQWTAPEIIDGGIFSHLADVFSFGIVIWELLTGRAPYKGVPPVTLVAQIVRGEATLADPEGPRALVDLYRLCTRREPHRRPTFKDIEAALEKAHRDLAMASSRAVDAPLVD